MKTEINPSALYWASGNYCELRLPGEAILAICQAGSNDEAVEHWAGRIERYEFGPGRAWAPTPDNVRKELTEYGAWDSEELHDDDANWQRLVWVFAWSVSESDEPDCSEPA